VSRALSLFSKTLSSNATLILVNLNWHVQVRGALALFDFDDSSADTIRSFLLQCAAHPKFLVPPANNNKVGTFQFGQRKQQTLMQKMLVNFNFHITSLSFVCSWPGTNLYTL